MSSEEIPCFILETVSSKSFFSAAQVMDSFYFNLLNNLLVQNYC